MEPNTRIDLETVCKTCRLVFTLHGIDQVIEVGGGFDLSRLQCPSCAQSKFIFDILKVDDSNNFVGYHLSLAKGSKMREMEMPKRGVAKHD